MATRNPLEISLANFTVVNGENHLQRPVAGGVVQGGVLANGQTQVTNLTFNTETKQYSYTNFTQMFITYAASTA